jgi:hypothetical protein
MSKRERPIRKIASDEGLGDPQVVWLRGLCAAADLPLQPSGALRSRIAELAACHDAPRPSRAPVPRAGTRAEADHGEAAVEGTSASSGGRTDADSAGRERRDLRIRRRKLKKGQRDREECPSE